MSKIKNRYKEEVILLNEFNELTDDEQKELILNTLDVMYEGEVNVTNNMILKCIKLTFAKSDDYLYLTNKLVVEKENNRLTFKFKDVVSKKPLIIVFVFALIVGLMSATYSGLILLERMKLNIDLDGDGIPDLNIDLDGDDIPDINIDLNGDKIPDLNIDYKGNQKAVFNLDTTEDGKPDFNMVNDATTPELLEKCMTNCDLNGNGWPDINIDLNGDGIPDLDIDTDNDGVADLNIDLDGDGICDVMCDTTGDFKCDTNCIETEGYIKRSGPSKFQGPKDNIFDTGYLNIVYESKQEFIIDNLFPEDQPGDVPKEAVKRFTVTNDSIYTVAYKLSWVIESNEFVSDNFQYKIESNNHGYNTVGFITVPKVDEEIEGFILIHPKTTQDYNIIFKIVGMNEEQNYDMGKTFRGFLKVGD